jgi:hypothetical protein
MSEDMLKIVKGLLSERKGDSKRLREIIETLKQGNPVVMSDYRYIQDLVSGEPEVNEESRSTRPAKRDESIELLRIRLAEGQITINEFRELKKALAED